MLPGNRSIPSEPSGPVSPSSETLYFPRAGDQVDAILAQFLAAGTGPLRLAIYSFNRPIIVATVLDQKARVRLITDRVQAFGAEQVAALNTLQQAGVPIKVNHHSGLMHLKMAVRSDAVVVGSFNWTNAAETVNDEVLAIFNGPAQVARAAHLFDCMWDDAKRFTDWRPPTRVEMMLHSDQMPVF